VTRVHGVLCMVHRVYITSALPKLQLDSFKRAGLLCLCNNVRPFDPLVPLAQQVGSLVLSMAVLAA
jgi:hypothetical protein